MPSFSSEGIEIAYEVFGDGKPIVFVHGFGSNARTNWGVTGWIETVNQAGYRAVVYDNRGHGHSQKLYDPALYPTQLMAHDALNLLDHLGIEQAAFVGYSMGARISTYAGITAPDRVAAVVLGGMGIKMVTGIGGAQEIVTALRAPSLADVTTPVGRQYRIFAEYTHSDLEALATCMEAGREIVPESMARQLKVPALVAVGSDDDVGGPPEPLAALFEKGESLVIPRRDHMRATGDKTFKAGVLDFLKRVDW